MAKIRIPPALLIALLLIAFIGISLAFRIYLPYGQIFVGDEIKYGSNDAYLYARLVDNLAHNFPHLTEFDPYFLYPGGNVVTSLPSYHWITAIFAWIAGGGHPDQHTVDMVGVFLPAILGALTIIPVFFIGKTLFNKWVGIFAAALIAILPGEFLSRSMLGSGDNPVAEVFFTTTALAFLILAIKSASQNQLSFTHIFKREWKVILKPLIYSIFAGIFLGLYLTTWQGALIFIFIIILYLIIQYIINHLKNKSSDYLCIVGFLSLLPALIILLLNPMFSDITTAVVIAVLVPPILYGISKAMTTMKLKTYYYPITLVVIGVLSVVVVYFAAPDIFTTLLAKFKFVFFPTGPTAITTLETSPMLAPLENIYTGSVAWGNFTTSFFIAPWWIVFGVGAAAICGYLIHLNSKSRNGTALLTFLTIATVIIIYLTVNQVPIQYNITTDPTMFDGQVWFIPGIAFISFSILFYSFIKRRGEQPWYIAVLWIIAILLVLSLLMVFTTYSNIRYWALVPLAILIYILFKQSDGDEDLRFFIIWSLIILLIPMIQRRFQYYLSVNMALLSGYLSWQIIWLSGLRKLTQKAEEPKENLHTSKTKMKRKAVAEKRSMRLYYINAFLALVLVVLFIFLPNISLSQTLAPKVSFALSDTWQAAMIWMRDNTPEPMGDPEAYFRLYEAPPPGEEFKYPASAYGVTAWWDYGYWIMRIAQRIPSVNPSQSPDPIRKVAAFFLSLDNATADELRKELGSKYIIADYDIATGKFWAMLNWSGQDQEKFIPTFYVQETENRVAPRQVFSIDYFRTLVVRLYNFNGQGSPGGAATVITYQEVRDVSGILFKLVLDAQDFNSYQEALDYIATQDSSKKYEIVSVSPFVSPIPVEPVEDYELVYSSPTSNNATPAEIKIFEYTGDN